MSSRQFIVTLFVLWNRMNLMSSYVTTESLLPASSDTSCDVEKVLHTLAPYKILLALRPFTRSTVVMMHALEPFPTFPGINTSSLPLHELPFYDTASDVTRHKRVGRMITFERPIKHLLLKQKFSSGDSDGSMCWVNQMINTLTVLCCQNLVTAPVRWIAWHG